eukprot:7173482-Ditylum_brightwellii.AAC.1
MTACQKKKKAFAQVMGTVLDFKSTSPTIKAMGDLEFDSIKDTVAMDKEEVTRLLYTTKVTEGNKLIKVTKDVPMKSKKKLLHVLWWCNHEILLRLSKLVTTED